MLDQQLTFRLTPTDTANILRIATLLRDRHGQPFVTRTDAVRFALDGAAKDVAKLTSAGTA